MSDLSFFIFLKKFYKKIYQKLNLLLLFYIIIDLIGKTVFLFTSDFIYYFITFFKLKGFLEYLDKTSQGSELVFKDMLVSHENLSLYLFISIGLITPVFENLFMVRIYKFFYLKIEKKRF